MKTLIGPGTNSWKISIFDEESNEFIDKEFDTTVIIENPKIFEVLNFIKALNANYISTPSKYGIPLKNINELTGNDLFKIS